MINSVMFITNPNHNSYGNYVATPKVFKFPAGECHVSFNEDKDFGTYCRRAETCFIVARINNSDDLLHLVMVTETIRHLNSSIRLEVTIPYWPAARQDRRNGYESLGCKVYANIINAQNYDSVVIYDAHSDVALALINNCFNASPLEFIKRAIDDFVPDVLVSPDAGMTKKIGQYNLNLPIVTCGKKRNPETGKITDQVVYDDGVYDRMLIIDDIGDGFNGHIGTADLLRDHCDAEHIGIYVTHGIFSGGTTKVENAFDSIYCTDTYRTDLENTNTLKIFKI